MLRLLACWIILALAGNSPLAAQSLKLVMQTAGDGAFDAAGWTPDGRWLIEASGHERVVRIWDPRADIIVDSIRLPLPGKRPDEKLVLDDVTVSADGLRARVEAVVVTENDAIGDIGAAAIDYDVDLVTRRVVIVPTTRDVDNPTRIFPSAGEVPDIDAGRPVLPQAPDGTRLVRGEGGVLLLDAAANQIGQLTTGVPAETRWASVSPDGTMVVFLSPKRTAEKTEAPGKPGDTVPDDYKGPVVELVVFNIVTGQSGNYGQPWDNYGDYSRIGWTGDGRLLLSEDSSAFARERKHDPNAKGEPSTGWIIDVVGTRELVEVSPGCFLQPLGGDRLVSAGLSNCRHGVAQDHAIWVRPLEGEWVELPVGLRRGTTVDALRASPDGRLLALSTGRKGKANSLLIVDSRTGKTLHSVDLEGPMITALAFMPDSQSLIVLGSRWAAHWRFAQDDLTELPATDFNPSMIASDGAQLLFGGIMSPVIQRLRLGDDAAMPPLEVQAPISGGFIKGRSIFWVGTATGELKLFDQRTHDLIATVQRFRDDETEYFIVHDPFGRYDSNLPPNIVPFRWLVADAPFQSLAPQTFMRALYTPDLLARLLECTHAMRCGEVLPQVTDLTALNRTLPVVEQVDVQPGSGPDRVHVTVTLRNGVNERPSGAYSQSLSGMHNLRLFRNGMLVAEAGGVDPGMDAGNLDAWREATRLRPNQADGTVRHLFRDIRLPTGGDRPVTFSAYAFNEDRVKGEEREAEFQPPPTQPRPRRLFILTIGVDAYPGGLFRPLRYAVADARAMQSVIAEAFVHPAEMRGLDIVRINVEGTAEEPATQARIARAALQLRSATPDDIVVLSFSGHGYTDGRGQFALVPSDVRTVGDKPVMASMIGSDVLARWLMPLDAGAIHVVIDACHSAASVLAGGFKPGPMGDPGLGQLAYDKGVRILSASAPDQFAMEDTRLGHGLLTYAMVIEGAMQGKADADADGIVTMDELMAYAVARLPAMAEPELADASDGPGMVVEWAGPPVPRQTPKLFDFAPEWSPLALRPGLARANP